MKLELLVSQMGQSPHYRELGANDQPLIVQCIWGGSTAQGPSRDDLIQFENGLHRDILRASQIKRKIDEAFLESCFAKWRHSLVQSEWRDHLGDLSVFVILAPPLSGGPREVILATWGDISLFDQLKDQEWNANALTSPSSKEGKGQFQRYRHFQKGLIAAVSSPSSIPLHRLKSLPRSREFTASLGQKQIDTVKSIHAALGKNASWALVRIVGISNWNPLKIFTKLSSIALQGIGKLVAFPFSSRKIATVTTGILLSILCTSFLLIYTTRSKTLSAPIKEPLNFSEKKAVPKSFKASDQPISSGDFRPYSAWISWLQTSPQVVKKTREKRASKVFSSEQKLNTLDQLGARRGEIKPSESLSLQGLEKEIQRDLANLQRHRETLAQIANRQGNTPLSDKSPSLRWFEEEQKRSEQHLLLARSSLEKLSRQYGEFSSLSPFSSSTSPLNSGLETTEIEMKDQTAKSKIDLKAAKSRKSQRSMSFTSLSSLTHLRQRLHFPLADSDLPGIENWIDEMTGWNKNSDRKKPKE